MEKDETVIAIESLHNLVLRVARSQSTHQSVDDCL